MATTLILTLSVVFVYQAYALRITPGDPKFANLNCPKENKTYTKNHPDECFPDQFVICLYGVPDSISPCYKNQHFDEAIQGCVPEPEDYKLPAHCKSGNPTTCEEAGNIGYVEYPGDCRFYTWCTPNGSFKMFCPRGAYYKTDKRECVYKSSGDITEEEIKNCVPADDE